MEREKLVELIETAAPPRCQAEWDLSGVQVAGDSGPAKRLAVTLDPTPEAIRQALSWQADLILAHHPLTLTPRLPSRRDDYHEALRLTLGAGVTLYAAHTSLDCQLAGPAGWLARVFGLAGLSALSPLPGAEGPLVGFGFVGDLPAPLPLPEFLALLAGHLPRAFFTAAGPEPKTVRRLACLPGSGADAAPRAFALGADVFVTGDVKYHQAQAAAGMILDVGHFVIEEEMMRRFAAGLSEQLAPSGVSVRFFPGREPFRLLAGEASTSDPTGLRP